MNRTEPRLIELLRKLVALNRTAKLFLLLMMDGVLCVLAVLVAFSLRFGEWDLRSPAVLTAIALCVGLWLPIFTSRGIYRSVVRFMGSRTMVGIAVSCMLMSLLLALFFLVRPVPGIPRTIAVIQPMVFGAFLVISRLSARYVLFDLLNQRNFAGRQSRVLIYGAGSAGRQLAVSMRHEPGMVLCGYIEDDSRLGGKYVDGARIYCSRDLPVLVQRLAIDTVLLALPRISRQRREQIVRKFEGIQVRVMTLPAMGDLVDGSVSISDLREMEISDLLGRDPVPPNDLLLNKTIKGRSVMITGAGGSIGSELCRQISQLQPASIILVEMTEHALYMIEAELREGQKDGRFCGDVTIRAELANVADRDTVKRLFDRWRPETVFHAAAYKHVPLVEENAVAGMRNNIFGTLNCALEAERAGATHFILVSTDKAVRPTNVMGSTKRVCELVLQALAARRSQTRFAMVRFGNVLGSSGSVVPRFQRQIRQGGPVTLTHRDITRYFMTIPEAAQLVIQAGAMAEGGEVYVLDMGQPVRIYDLARTMINLSGLSVRDTDNPDGDIEICEIGLRKGEKLYEELLIGDAPRLTLHLRIMQARESYIEWPELLPILDRMEVALRDGDRETSMAQLCTLVPEYQSAQATAPERAA
jgi:FlaA1/EpsC-like NDP-sugar epimerase